MEYSFGIILIVPIRNSQGCNKYRLVPVCYKRFVLYKAYMVPVPCSTTTSNNTHQTYFTR